LGRLPWDYTLDLDFSFKPQAVKGLQMRVDIYNVLNKQTVTAITEIHESPGDPATLDSTYGRPIAYSAPRSVKFTADYAF
jgi:outer membrane receptor protein involved in Fe transport